MTYIKSYLSTFMSYLLIFLLFLVSFGCNEQASNPNPEPVATKIDVSKELPEYFLLRPDVEKAYGYSHAVKIGNSIKVSGAVSMDDQGNPTAVGDLNQQMINCYADLEKVLTHFGCSFEDVVVENIFTTDMPKFLEISGYRNEIYTKHFPTGTWLGVNELALPEFLIEIELEVHKSE